MEKNINRWKELETADRELRGKLEEEKDNEKETMINSCRPDESDAKKRKKNAI